MNMKKILNGCNGSILLSVLEILVGILLLIDPLGFTAGIIKGAGVLAILAGLVESVRYFLAAPQIGAQRQSLFRGLVSVLLGVTAIVKYEWFINAFPLLTALYALVMLVVAAYRLQKMADMIRMKEKRWYMPGIAAALAAILATVILLNPFGAVAAVWTFAALSLIVEAVVDLVTVFLM